MSSLLGLKLLFLSYFNTKQQHNLLQDCSSAIDRQANHVSTKLKEHLKQIKSISEQQQQQQQDNLHQYQNNQKHKNKPKRKNKKQMEVILEQFTERSVDQNNYKQNNDNDKEKYFMHKFNSSISVMKNAELMIDQIVYLYKTELRDLAVQLTESKRTINVLADQLKEVRHENATLKKTYSGNNSSQLQSHQIGKRKGSTPNIQNDEQNELFARLPPKPYDYTINKNKQNEVSNKIVQNYILKNKWSELSSKIAQLKQKLSCYQSQLFQKQTEIKTLNQQIKRLKTNTQTTQTQQKKKMKAVSTTLRGQKIMLQNQLHSQKKKLKQQEEITNIYQVQNKKLKLQIQNLQSTVKWHLNTINDLRNNFSKGLKEDGDLLNKLKLCEQSNKRLLQTVTNQELYLKQYSQKLKEIETSYNKKIQLQQKKIQELQHMIDLKNQTIIKIKMKDHAKFNEEEHPDELKKTAPLFQTQTQKVNSAIAGTIKYVNTQQKDSNYYTQMIRILTKKLQDRQQIIRNQNLVIKQMRMGEAYNTFNTQMD